MEAVEGTSTQKGLGYVQMPSKRNNGDLRVMPSYIKRIDVSALKVVNPHQNNPSRTA